MEQLQKLFAELLASQRFAEEELDYGIVKRHVENLSTSSLFTGSAISIFDLCHRSHVYESEYHKALFSDPDGVYEGMRIHPDDYATVMKHGVAGMKHVFMRKDNLNVRQYKLIREYRALVHGSYRRITEEMQVLETDRRGNVWLVLSIVNLSPNQSMPFKAASQLIDTRTGDAFSPLEAYFDKDEILSPRELEILRWIEKGKLSKEIADILNISPNTVNTHRQRILRKLKVDNSIEALKYAWILGLLDNGITD